VIQFRLYLLVLFLATSSQGYEVPTVNQQVRPSQQLNAYVKSKVERRVPRKAHRPRIANHYYHSIEVVSNPPACAIKTFQRDAYKYTATFARRRQQTVSAASESTRLLVSLIYVLKC
jgi:hypothetical protein